MRIDAHQHFWIYNHADYVWMGPEHRSLRRDFTADDLEPLLDSVDFDGSIAVQARQMIKETEWLLEIADRKQRVFGVVGWLDLCSEQISDQIDEFARRPELCGVRHVVHDEPDDDFMLRKDFRRGISLLESADLTYDLLIFPRHLSRSIDLVDEFPNQPFVVDHIAKPPIAAGDMDGWDSDIRTLAERENVFCKLSGMVTEAGQSWSSSDFVPYIDVIVDAFGPDRLMIGSDWPVSTLRGEYQDVMRVVLDYVENLSQPERDAICGETCRAFYGVGS